MINDLRYALRLLFRSPVFSVTAALALALGIGANTAIFSIVNATLLRPLPYNEPDKITMLWGNVKRVVVERRGASYPDYVDWRDKNRSFESVAAFWSATFTLYGINEPERLNGEVVAAGYFPLLGVSAKVGRVFRPEEDVKPDAHLVAVIGEALWQRRFGGRGDVTGSQIRLDNRTYTVIGVMPREFRGMSDNVEIWVPVMASGLGDSQSARGSRWFAALARLKPGVSREQAQAEMDSLSKQLEKAYPDTNEKRAVEVASLQNEVVGDVRPALLVILGAVGFVLLIACANVASLVLARAEARQREMAIRTALGAGRQRLVRQLLIESIVLTSAGAVLGLIASRWGVDALMAASPIQLPTFAKVSIDAAVIGYTGLVTIATALVLGLIPAFSTASKDIYESLKESSGRVSAGAARKNLRGALVVAEIAITLVLLVGAGLFIRTFQRLTSLDAGFRPEGLLSLRVSFPFVAPPPANATTQAQPDQQTVSASRQLLSALRTVPGVQEASLCSDIPLSGEGGAVFYSAEGQPPVNAQNMPRAYLHRVTLGFFKSLGIRMLQGRDFLPEEMDGKAPSVIASQAVAQRFWPGQNPIGKRVKAGRPDSQAPYMTIVGVVDEVKYRALPRNPTPDPDFYLPFNERARNFAVLVRTRVDPSSVIAAVRNRIREVDAAAVVFNVLPMSDRVSQQLQRSRFTTWLMAVFAGAALILAMIGIYGVMTHAVAERTQEIGIRMALGASRSDVLGMVGRHALLLVAIGTAIGVVAALMLTRLVKTLLYDIVSATDLLVFVAVPALLILTAMIATWLPVRRATRVDPLIALRYE